MSRVQRAVLVTFAAAAALAITAAASELVPGQIETELVSGPVEYYALLPPGYSTTGERYPLVIDLHGGGGSRDKLAENQPLYDGLWADGRIPPMVVVMPSALQRGFYLDLRDGSQRWESFLIGPFLDHLRERFHVRTDARGTMLTGGSMGGMGSLRMAFKHPDRFGAVAALEPGIDPVLEWDEMRPKHRFWRDDELMERAYGKPIDEEFYAKNNPAWIAAHNADAIRASGLKILVEAGDQDMYWLYEAAEFLHQVLWKHRIRHDYHLYLGDDHIGPSLGPRKALALEFLAESLIDPVEHPSVTAGRKRLAPMKAVLDEADHYGVDQHLVGEAVVSPTYAESSALVAMSDDGSTEIGLRIARFPGRREGTLWLSAFAGDERYGVALDDVDLGGFSGATPVERDQARFAVGGPASASIECRQRHTAEMICTARAEAMTHEDLHPPLGAGSHRLRVEAVFRARHAGDLARAGRMEVFGTVEATIETPRGAHSFTSRGKYHEQTGDRPRFAGPFTYFAVQGERGSLLARGGGGTTFGFALLDGETVKVDTFTIDPLGTPQRAFRVELEDGRTLEGRTEVVRETSVPIEGQRRPSATVEVSTNLGPMIGHLNDWQPPP
jgi:S-formylglutathione hydrolase